MSFANKRFKNTPLKYSSRKIAHARCRAGPPIVCYSYVRRRTPRRGRTQYRNVKAVSKEPTRLYSTRVSSASRPRPATPPLLLSGRLKATRLSLAVVAFALFLLLHSVNHPAPSTEISGSPWQTPRWQRGRYLCLPVLSVTGARSTSVLAYSTSASYTYETR